MTEPVTPGVYRLNWGPGNPYNGLYHVRVIVDDEWVVFRRWRRFKWEYQIENQYWFKIRMADGGMKRVGDEVKE